MPARAYNEHGVHRHRARRVQITVQLEDESTGHTGPRPKEMKEQYFFADVDLPFHVWVREDCGHRGYRWVLRDRSHLHDGAAAHSRGAADRSAARRASSPPA